MSLSVVSRVGHGSLRGKSGSTCERSRNDKSVFALPAILEDGLPMRHSFPHTRR